MICYIIKDSVTFHVGRWLMGQCVYTGLEWPEI